MNGSHGGGLSPEKEERLSRYLSGSLSVEERTAFEAEALADDALAHALYSDRLLASVAPAEVGASHPRSASGTSFVSRIRGSFSARFWWPLALGAAAVLGFVLLRPPREDRPIFRGGNVVSTPIAPVGALQSLPERFVWTSAEGAATYRIRVYDPEARVVGEATTADTFLVAGRWIDFDVLGSATWTVTPEAPGRDFRLSPPVRFQLPR